MRFVTHVSLASGGPPAVIVAVLLSSAPLAGQAQAVAGATQAQPAARDEAVERERQLIRDVADSLRAKEAPAKTVATPKNWKPARTPWGDPDLSGIYSNSDESGIPFEKPPEFEGRGPEDITPAELAKIQETRREATIGLAARLSQDP